MNVSRVFSDTEVYLYVMTSCIHTSKFFALQNEVVAFKLFVGSGPWPVLITQLCSGVVQVVLLGINQNYVRYYAKNLCGKWSNTAWESWHCPIFQYKAAHMSLSLICLGHFRVLCFLMDEHTTVSFCLQAIHQSLLR